MKEKILSNMKCYYQLKTRLNDYWQKSYEENERFEVLQEATEDCIDDIIETLNRFFFVHKFLVNCAKDMDKVFKSLIEAVYAELNVKYLLTARQQ